MSKEKKQARWPLLDEYQREVGDLLADEREHPERYRQRITRGHAGQMSSLTAALEHQRVLRKAEPVREIDETDLGY